MNNLETRLVAIAEGQEANSKKLDMVVQILTGNGDPSAGLVVRFDRVEQRFLADVKEKSRIKLLLIGAIVGFLANAGLFLTQLFQRSS